MKLRLVAVGQRMPGWVATGFDEYARRLPPHLALELCEVPPGQRGRRPDPRRARTAEAQALRAQVREARLVALDGGSPGWSTEALSRRLDQWLAAGSDVALVIGGPDGLDPTLLAEARERWSLGPLTLPHPLVRVVVAEQLYRAWTILSGHPYHRA